MYFLKDNKETAKYVYFGDDLLFEINGSDQIMRWYITPSLDQNLMRVEGSDYSAGNRYYYFQDGLGSVSEIRNASTVQNVYRYNAFGETYYSSESIFNRIKYTSRTQDRTESGGQAERYDYRNRLYFPGQARFSQVDPVFGANLYKYVGNNPVRYKDSLGMYVLEWYESFYPIPNKIYLVIFTSKSKISCAATK